MKLKSVFNTILLLIILFFFGFVFWLGWEQVELSEQSYGLVYTNTSGWKEKVIKSSNFNWSFEKVIPNNYTLHKFILMKKNIGFSFEEELPSGALYASFNSIDSNDFKYNYTLTGNIIFDYKYLYNKVSNNEFNTDTYTEWENIKILEIQNILKSFIKDRIINSETLTVNTSAREYIQERYPYFIIDDIFINFSLPDMYLYNSARNRYLQNIEMQTSAEEKYLTDVLEQQNRENLKLELLKKYGEVFTQYPIMIEYLKVDKNMVLDRAKLEDFFTLENQK
ncbi:MAG: hypothetical protein JXR64_08685 [Spirochaetales bacterium]|nr:hypothetical protein [Spirochaetales bacterium]